MEDEDRKAELLEALRETLLELQGEFEWTARDVFDEAQLVMGG